MKNEKTSKITKRMNAVYSDEVARYKEMALKRKDNSKINQKFISDMYFREKAYVEKCEKTGTPITMSGITMASGLSSKSFKNLRDGEYDYSLHMFADYYEVNLDGEPHEYIDGIPAVNTERGVVLLAYGSELIERFCLLHQNQTEIRMYENGKVTDIFTLKAQHKWQEEEKQQVQNNTLVIASESEAKMALSNLMQLKDTNK